MSPKEEAVEDIPSDLGSLAILLRRVASTPGARSLPVGTRIAAGRYTIERFLGRGATGSVYAVRDAALDDLAALKILHAELAGDPESLRRLRDEVRLARRVSHPNVCRVHDIGEDGGRRFVTMELVNGRSLRHWLRTAQADEAPLAATLDLVNQICAAVTAAHRAGVMHRDIKPDNVVLEGARAVLTDFGVAGLVHDRDPLLAGTPGYIAPELLRGERVDHRADVYSTAVVAYELVTGAQPFAARTVDASRALAVERPPAPRVPASLGDEAVREALDGVFARALHPDPDRRIDSAAELARAIAHAVRNAPDATAPRTRSRAITDPATTTAPRAELRVATAVVYRPLAVDAEAIEAFEREVVDRGGALIAAPPGSLAALFGVPRSLGDDAERAARAAQALVARGGSAGLDTVRVVLRAGAAPAVDPAALAAASELAAARRGVLASSMTSRQLAARFDLAAVPSHREARGVLGPRPTTPRIHAATSRIGELAALLAIAEDSFTRRRPRHGEVRAPAGFGKSRLRDAMIARLRERREIEWVCAEASPYDDAAPFALLRAASPAWYAAATRHGTADRARAFAAARRWLEARAEHGPVAVVVDDLPWADQLSRELIGELAVSLDDVPVFIATFARFGEDTPAAPATGVDVITLGPLGLDPAADVVRGIAPGATAEAIAEVVRRAAGHPYFLEELARELADHGRAEALPKTIEAVVQARLDRLVPAARDVLAVAAMLGPVFSYPALAALAGEASDAAALDAAIAILESLELVARERMADAGGAERYRFCHELVRDVAYARIAAGDRRTMHASAARWLARANPGLAEAAAGADGDVGEDAIAAYAHHLAAAGDPAASGAFRAAGLRYLAASAYRDAATALRRSAELAPAIDAVLAVALGDAALQCETIAEAADWYRRALDGTPAEDAPARALLWHKLGTAAMRGGDHTEALACFAEGIALASPGGTLAPWAEADPRTAALLHGSTGWVTGYVLADNERGAPACERAVELLEGTPYQRDLAHALSRLGATLMRANRFRDQLACNRRNLQIAIDIGDPMMEVTACVNLGVVLGVLGEVDDAIAHTERARELAARLGARSVSAIIESNLAGLYLEVGRLAAAGRSLDHALRHADRTGVRVGLAETYVYAARLRAIHGDLADAERWARRSLALAESTRRRLDEGVALRTLAQVLARAGDDAGARAAIDDARRRLAGVDGYELARCEAALARIARRAGDAATAEAARAAALAALSRLGAAREAAVIDELDEVR